MKYCGIELKSNEARIVCIELTNQDYQFLAPSVKKIALKNPKMQEASIEFRETFNSFFKLYKFDKIGIKERMRKGKFAGGADSFKMEGILQSLNYPIVLVHTNTIKSAIKGKAIKIGEIHKYQEEALKTALSLT